MMAAGDPENAGIMIPLLLLSSMALDRLDVEDQLQKGESSALTFHDRSANGSLLSPISATAQWIGRLRHGSSQGFAQS